MPERWAHTKGVAHRPEQVAVTVPAARDILIAAAWLPTSATPGHSGGPGSTPSTAPLPPKTRLAGPDRALVAHHSGARFVPVERGFADQMAGFPFQDSPVSDG